MKVTDIIQKHVRTESELRYVFETIFHSQNSVGKSLKFEDLPEFNKICDNHRLLSKSRLNLKRWCPSKFRFKYWAGISAEEPRQIMIDGKNLHFGDDYFWKHMKEDDLLHASNVEHLIYSQYTKIIPAESRTDFINRMIDAWVYFEANRIKSLFRDLGQKLSVIREFVFPVATELPIENWDSNLMGIIDRIDRLSNGALAVIEYKYGKPKYLDTSKASEITHELAFYNLLVQGKNQVYAVTDAGCVPLAEHLGFKPNFYYGAMIFFQDVQNTAKLFKIKQIHMKSVLAEIKRYWDDMNAGNYKCVPNDSCYEWCEFYWDLCEKNPEWEDIESLRMDPKITTEITDNTEDEME